ncbi:unnamed protein product [Lactuca saligna]|uniref:Reverse transcriptase zinc-binding domain-containing protein n=1 Tax=Lactuca saligna TaxID=75948 RepID=A0AA35VZL5_LACSI|nr:unnamed protein product [Lactuca saligna]
MVAYGFVLFSLCDGKRAETDDTVSNTPATLETFAERFQQTKRPLKKKNIQVQTVLDKRIVNNGVIWRCGLTPDSSFTVNALRSRWAYRIPITNKNFHRIKEIPLKVSCCICGAQWGRIPTTKELVKRWVNMENLTCQMCNVKEESTDHILVDCAYAKNVMEGVMRWCKVDTHMEDLQAVSDVLNLANKWGTCTKKWKPLDKEGMLEGAFLEAIFKEVFFNSTVPGTGCLP